MRKSLKSVVCLKWKSYINESHDLPDQPNIILFELQKFSPLASALNFNFLEIIINKYLPS